eukprot:COSAG05_NODE_276_length_12393_cov_1737.505694_21_plen_115_part_00
MVHVASDVAIAAGVDGQTPPDVEQIPGGAYTHVYPTYMPRLSARGIQGRNIEGGGLMAHSDVAARPRCFISLFEIISPQYLRYQYVPNIKNKLKHKQAYIFHRGNQAPEIRTMQ